MCHLFETHLHTCECDKVVTIPTAETVRLYHEKGYDGIVVTNHYFSLFLDWFGNETGSGTHKEIIDRWLSGYREAKRAGEACGMTILPGAEVRFDGCINDFLLYGVDEAFFYNAPPLHRLKNAKELAMLLPPEACLVQAHPFRDNMVVRTPTDVWGIEAYNGCNPPIRNLLAAEYARFYGKLVTSGSDFHAKEHLARGGIRFDADITSSKEFGLLLQSGAYSCVNTEK